MNRYIALLITFAFGAYAAPPLMAQPPADSAAPSDVYLLYHEHQSQQVAELKQAAETLKPLEAEGKEEGGVPGRKFSPRWSRTERHARLPSRRSSAMRPSMIDGMRT